MASQDELVHCLSSILPHVYRLNELHHCSDTVAMEIVILRTEDYMDLVRVPAGKFMNSYVSVVAQGVILLPGVVKLALVLVC